METSKVFVEIDSETFGNLERIAANNGLDSVEKLISQFAEKFSTRNTKMTMTKSKLED